MEQSEDKQITLAELWRVFLRRWWILLLAGILCAGAVFAYVTLTTTPLYAARAKVYVNNNSATTEKISTGDLAASQSLVNTYCEIVKSRMTLERVIEQGAFPYSYEQLLTRLTVTPVTDTEIFSISATAGTPEEAADIVNTILVVLPDRITDIFPQGTSCGVVDNAIPPKAPISSGRTTKTVVGFFVGVLASFIICFFADVVVNDRIESEDYLKQTFGDAYPLLAVVPDVNTADIVKGGRYGYYNKKTDAKGGEEDVR